MSKDDYSDLLDLPRPVIPGHPPMPMKDRAAQFSSFAALAGFDEELEKTREAVERAQAALEQNAPLPEEDT